MKASLAIGAAAFLAGVVLHLVAVVLRDFGPAWDSISFRGNGALVILPVALAALIVAEVVCIRERAWAGMALAPVGLFAGLFVVLGSF